MLNIYLREEDRRVQYVDKHQVKKTTAAKKRKLDPSAERTCWQFNSGATCKFGDACKYAHKCSECSGTHTKVNCTKKVKSSK